MTKQAGGGRTKPFYWYDVFSLYSFIAIRSARSVVGGRMILNIAEFERKTEQFINVADVERYFAEVAPHVTLDIILGVLFRNHLVFSAKAIGVCDTHLAYKALAQAGLFTEIRNVEQFIHCMRVGPNGLSKR